MKQLLPKILLIEPPFYRLFKETYSLDRYPLSLGFLAGAIKKKTNWRVKVYNADFYPHSETQKYSFFTSIGFENYLKNLKELSVHIWREIRSTLVEYNPTVVGISVKSQNFESAYIIAKLVKENNKQTVVIMGGPHPSMVGSDLLKYPEIDICVVGEGENTIIELLNAIQSNKKLNSIKGIIFKKDGQIFTSPPRDFIENLDSLNFPHEYAPEVLKDYNQYPVTAFKNIFAIRGCPYNCIFCGSKKIWSRRVRFRSPENVIKEIKGLQKMGLRFVSFNDDNFGINKKYINDLCNALIQYCPGIKWECEMHINLVDEENISLMKKAGCYSIQVGIESGNNEILSAIRKNITIEEAIMACKIIKKHGIYLQTFFIVGFPQETEDTLNDTFKAMKKIKCDTIIYSIFTPYPGTEIFEFCKEKGLIDDNYNVSLYNHQSPMNCFCLNITRERFRVLIDVIEKMVDRKNSLNRIKRIFSLNTFGRIRELGIGKSIKKGMMIFLGK
ncbi:B12-binding domain-containing radical SAM protein [Candidatus Latescibacterota bacterium]